MPCTGGHAGELWWLPNVIRVNKRSKDTKEMQRADVFLGACIALNIINVPLF